MPPSTTTAPSFAGAALRVMARSAVSGEPVETAVAGLHLEGAGNWSAFGREGGAIRFDGLPAAAGTVTVSSLGFVDGSAPVELVEGIEVVVDVALHPVPTITGRVVSDATGLPVPGAEIRATDRPSHGNWTGGPPASRTGPDGAFSVTAGDPGADVHFDVRAEGFVRELVVLQMPAAGTEPHHPEFRLHRAGRLRGVVLDAAGRPAAGACVEVRVAEQVAIRTLAVAEEWPYPPFENQRVGPVLSSGANGSFVAEGLDAGGLYRVEASTDSAWGSADRVLVPEDGGEGRVEVRLGPGGTLVVRTVFGEGVKPSSPRLSVMGRRGSARGTRWGVGPADVEIEFTPDPDVEFEPDAEEKSVPGTPVGEGEGSAPDSEVPPWRLGVPPGTYDVRGSVPRASGEAVATVGSGETVEVVLTVAGEVARVEKLASISGSVVDDRGHPYAGVMVTAVTVSDLSRGGLVTPSGEFFFTGPSGGIRSWAETDADGRFLLPRLPAGESWRITAGEWGTAVETAAPAEGVFLTLARAASLRGKAVMPRGRIGEGTLTVRAVASGRGGRWKPVSAGPTKTEEGAFEIPGVAPGPVRLWLQRGSFVGGPVEVSLAPGEEKDLGDVLLRPGEPMAGRLVDPGGRAVAGARMNLESEWQETSRCVTGADGSFLLGVRPPLPWPVEVTGDACVPTVLTVDPAAPAPLRLVVPRGGLLRGRVRDGAGLPAAGAVVEAAPAGGGEARRLPVNHLGRFEARLPADVYQLVIHWEGTAVPAGDVRLVEGGNSDLALPVR